MPSLPHEAPLALFRDRPDLVPTLLREVLRVEVPPFDEARVVDADHTQIVPAEFRADLVVVLYAAGQPAMGLIVEVQRQIDGRSSPCSRRSRTTTSRAGSRWCGPRCVGWSRCTANGRRSTLIYAALNDATRRSLEVAVFLFKYQYPQSEFARKHCYAGKAEGEANAILTVLAARRLVVSDEERAQILACTDLPTLERWLTRAVSAPTTADVLGDD